MGKRNRKRREVRHALLRLGAARLDGDDSLASHLRDVLTRGGAAKHGRPGHKQTIHEADRLLLEGVGAAWERGWQPADLPRFVQAKLRTRESELVVDTIAAEAVTYQARAQAAAVDPRWLDQLAALDALPGSHPGPPVLVPWMQSAGVDWREALLCAAALAALLAHLPRLPTLIPHPHDPAAGAPMHRPPPGVDRKVLDRVRALLAKAESTEFEAEAQAFSAKAQELMTRYSIDHSVVPSDHEADAKPDARRVGVEPPYAGAKATLLSAVASANACRAVSSTDLCFSTVVGYVNDLEATELLYTSLLVQAASAMRAAGSVRDAVGRSRTRSFRHAFLVGFANRIGHRLREAARKSTEEAEAWHGRSLLPVLAGRSAKVDQVLDELFPAVTKVATSVSNSAGFYAGSLAAEQAFLNVRPEVRGSATV